MQSYQNKHIQACEHEILRYGENEHLNKQQFESLVKFNDRNKSQYFTVVNRGIKLKQFVGVIKVDGLTIEILPKIDKEQKKDLSQKFLIDLLRICRKINISSASSANLWRKYKNLLDYYLYLFLDEVLVLANEGLVKKYRYEDDNLHVLKGKLLTTKNIQKNLLHHERFYQRYQNYDYDNLYNQILLRALQLIPIVTNNPSLLSLHKKIEILLPELKPRKIKASQFDKIRYDRKTLRYKNAIELAKMIILNYMPDITQGRHRLIAILFDMNKLFEEYIYRILKKKTDDDFQVEMHRRKKFWKSKLIIPDLLITKGDEKFIIDTKWKSVVDNTPSDSDLKQMFVYNEYFNTSQSILLYPRFDNSKFTFSNFTNREHGCKLAFVDLVKDGKLNYEVGEEVVGALNT